MALKPVFMPVFGFKGMTTKGMNNKNHTFYIFLKKNTFVADDRYVETVEIFLLKNFAVSFSTFAALLSSCYQQDLKTATLCFSFIVR